MRRLIKPLIILALLALLLWLVFGYLLTVRHVYVSGSSVLTGEEALELSGVPLRSSMLRLDERLIAARIEKSGRVAVRSVRRSFPSSLYIELSDRSPAGMVVTGGRLAIIDEAGYVMQVVNNAPDGMTLYLTGTGATNAVVGSRLNTSEEKLDAISALLRAVRSEGVTDLCVDIDVSTPDAVTVTTPTGIRVQLGDTKRLPDKLAWMRTAVADLIARGQIHGSLDVSSSTKADYSP